MVFSSLRRYGKVAGVTVLAVVAGMSAARFSGSSTALLTATCYPTLANGEILGDASVKYFQSPLTVDVKMQSFGQACTQAWMDGERLTEGKDVVKNGLRVRFWDRPNWHFLSESSFRVSPAFTDDPTYPPPVPGAQVQVETPAWLGTKTLTFIYAGPSCVLEKMGDARNDGDAEVTEYKVPVLCVVRFWDGVDTDVSLAQPGSHRMSIGPDRRVDVSLRENPADPLTKIYEVRARRAAPGVNGRQPDVMIQGLHPDPTFHGAVITYRLPSNGESPPEENPRCRLSGVPDVLVSREASKTARVSRSGCRMRLTLKLEGRAEDSQVMPSNQPTHAPFILGPVTVTPRGEGALDFFLGDAPSGQLKVSLEQDDLAIPADVTEFTVRLNPDAEPPPPPPAEPERNCDFPETPLTLNFKDTRAFSLPSGCVAAVQWIPLGDPGDALRPVRLMNNGDEDTFGPVRVSRRPDATVSVTVNGTDRGSLFVQGRSGEGDRGERREIGINPQAYCCKNRATNTCMVTEGDCAAGEDIYFARNGKSAQVNCAEGCRSPAEIICCTPNAREGTGGGKAGQCNAVENALACPGPAMRLQMSQRALCDAKIAPFNCSLPVMCNPAAAGTDADPVCKRVSYNAETYTLGSIPGIPAYPVAAGMDACKGGCGRFYCVYAGGRGNPAMHTCLNQPLREPSFAADVFSDAGIQGGVIYAADGAKFVVPGFADPRPTGAQTAERLFGTRVVNTSAEGYADFAACNAACGTVPDEKAENGSHTAQPFPGPVPGAQIPGFNGGGQNPGLLQPGSPVRNGNVPVPGGAIPQNPQQQGQTHPQGILTQTGQPHPVPANTVHSAMHSDPGSEQNPVIPDHVFASVSSGAQESPMGGSSSSPCGGGTGLIGIMGHDLAGPVQKSVFYDQFMKMDRKQDVSSPCSSSSAAASSGVSGGSSSASASSDAGASAGSASSLTEEIGQSSSNGTASSPCGEMPFFPHIVIGQFNGPLTHDLFLDKLSQWDHGKSFSSPCSSSSRQPFIQEFDFSSSKSFASEFTVSSSSSVSSASGQDGSPASSSSSSVAEGSSSKSGSFFSADSSTSGGWPGSSSIPGSSSDPGTSVSSSSRPCVPGQQVAYTEGEGGSFWAWVFPWNWEWPRAVIASLLGQVLPSKQEPGLIAPFYPQDSANNNIIPFSGGSSSKSKEMIEQFSQGSSSTKTPASSSSPCSSSSDTPSSNSSSVVSSSASSRESSATSISTTKTHQTVKNGPTPQPSPSPSAHNDQPSINDSPGDGSAPPPPAPSTQPPPADTPSSGDGNSSSQPPASSVSSSSAPALIADAGPSSASSVPVPSSSSSLSLQSSFSSSLSSSQVLSSASSAAPPLVATVESCSQFPQLCSIPSVTFSGNPFAGNVMHTAAGVCGNGIGETGESCDDGNGDDRDSCSNGCARGNGSACSEGLDCASMICRGGACAACAGTPECPQPFACLAGRCVLTAVCGNGVTEFHEDCDDGNAVSGDGCSADCHHESVAEELCGNGRRDPGEDCDDGPRNADVLPGRCRTTCVKARCGDGLVDPGETCDDGNALPGDGCFQCRREEPVPPAVPAVTAHPAASPRPAFQPRVTFPRHMPLGSTGPGAVFLMAAGASGGWSWLRRRRR